MINAAAETEAEEKPLDPAMERVRRKMVRLLVVSIGVMMIGLMAVLAAIVYKTTSRDGEEAAVMASTLDGAPRHGTIRLPAGARLLSHSAGDGVILLQAALAEGGRALFVYDPRADRIVARYDIAVDDE